MFALENCLTNTAVCSQDELSNNLETLLEEVRIVQAQLSDLPNETLDAMEAGLVVRSLHIYFRIRTLRSRYLIIYL